jgi:uncharacterized protein (TIGR03067 family)
MVKHLLCGLLLVGVCAGPLAWADEGASAKEDAKKLQGSWKPVKAELGGKPYPEGVLKMMKLDLTDGKYTVTIGQLRDEGTVKLDATKTPRTMDIVGTKGPNQGKTIPAIYELTDNTLRVCYDLSSKARPKEFKTQEGTQLYLVEYQRQKN